MRACAPHAKWPDQREFVQLPDVREFRDRGWRFVTSREHFADEHLRHALRGFTRVVIVVDVDDERAKRVLDMRRDFALQCLDIAFAQVGAILSLA